MARLKSCSSSKSPPPSPQNRNPNPKTPKKSIPNSNPKTPTAEHGGNSGGGSVSLRALTKEQEEEDYMRILQAVAEFTARNGSIPTPSTMKPVHEAVKGELHQKELTVDQLYNKFRTLKSRYLRILNAGVGPTSADRAFFDLSVTAWGELKRKNPPPPPTSKEREEEEEEMNNKRRAKKQKMAQEEENEPKKKKKKDDDAATDDDDAVAHDDDDDDDAAENEKEDAGDDDKKGKEKEDAGDDHKFRYVRDQATKYFKLHGLSMDDLELGLKFMDKSEAEVLEKRWRKFFEKEAKNDASAHDLDKEILDTLLYYFSKV